MTPATSAGEPMPLPMIGDIFVNSDQSALRGIMPGTDSVMPLVMPPGATATARKPCLLYSTASVCVSASTPPLLAA